MVITFLISQIGSDGDDDNMCAKDCAGSYIHSQHLSLNILEKSYYDI